MPFVFVVSSWLTWIGVLNYEKFVSTEALIACQRLLDQLVNAPRVFLQVTRLARPHSLLFCVLF